jgi:hypothetical protein
MYYTLYIKHTSTLSCLLIMLCTTRVCTSDSELNRHSVCMYVCVYVYVYVYTYVRTYVCIYGCVYVSVYRVGHKSLTDLKPIWPPTKWRSSQGHPTFPLDLIRSHMVVIHLFLMLCDL